MDMGRVFLDVALGDWEENEASVSCVFCSRCCQFCQRFPLRMSRNALGNTLRVSQRNQLPFRPHFEWLCRTNGTELKCERDLCKELWKQEAFCPNFSCFLYWDLYILAPEPQQMQSIFVPFFSVCGCNIHCIRCWAAVTHSLSNPLCSFSE